MFAAEIRVAVASNFNQVIKELIRQFELNSEHRVKLVLGSTGKLYAQIKNGAPFDAYFAADSKRPELLDHEGVAVSASRFSYAVGKLVLWSPKEGFVDSKSNVRSVPKVLATGGFHHLAIASPKLAPYGKAAEQVLKKLKLWKALQSSVVRGENIGQAFQFVKSGNAELGFVAYAQVKSLGNAEQGSYWEVPQSLYNPIVQQAVQLKENKATRDFLRFVKSRQAQQIIKRHGYGIADAG